MLRASLICPHGTICKTPEVRAQQRELWEFRDDHVATRVSGWGVSYWRWIFADLPGARFREPPGKEVLCPLSRELCLSSLMSDRETKGILGAGKRVLERLEPLYVEEPTLLVKTEGSSLW